MFHGPMMSTEEKKNNPPNIKHRLYVLCAITLLVLPIVGEFISRAFIPRPLIDVFQEGWEWQWQVLAGSAYGMGSAWIAREILRTPAMGGVRRFFSSLLYRMRLNGFEILLLSFSAGIGEELLFRGAVQPLLTIWPTAIIFVALHGYLNPYNWSLTLYGIYMILLSAGLGYLFEYAGIIAAITAHVVVDIILLYALRHHRLDPSESGSKAET
ncbi:MAG: CPBP family intramembrane glutamic endopeptidase [Bacteroidia bacterium]